MTIQSIVDLLTLNAAMQTPMIPKTDDDIKKNGKPQKCTKP